MSDETIERLIAERDAAEIAVHEALAARVAADQAIEAARKRYNEADKAVIRAELTPEGA